MGTNVMEIWRDIPSYRGFYQASNFGRIRSLPRVINTISGGTQKHKGKLLKAKARDRKKDSYLIVTLCKNGTEKQKKVHRLILEAFKGPCPPTLEGCHNDGNKYNNVPTNLRWDTRKGNASDKIKHGTAQRGEQSTNVRLSENDVRKMRYMRGKGGYTFSKLADMFGVRLSTVKSVIYRKTWKHV